VVAIPSSVFYGAGTAVHDSPQAEVDAAAGRTLVRWAFCKRVDVLEEALARLDAWG
jgi:hypothetical protein